MPNGEIDVSLITGEKFNKHESHEDFKGGCPRCQLEMRLAEEKQLTILELHSYYHDRKPLPGEFFLQAVKNDLLKPGDYVRLSKKSTGEDIYLTFLGVSRGLENPIDNKEYSDEEWQTTGPLQEVQTAASNLTAQVGENPLSRAVEEKRNSFAIVTCDSLKTVEKNPITGFAEFPSKYVLAFIINDELGAIEHAQQMALLRGEKVPA